jgi:hypothetical protein
MHYHPEHGTPRGLRRATGVGRNAYRSNATDASTPADFG